MKSKEMTLTGKTLQLYLYMVRHPKSHGIRELQRALGFSSPSLVVYHLNKLRDLGLVDIDETGNYVVIEKVKTGVLSLFIYLGNVIVPRHVFYASFFTSVLLLFLILKPFSLTFEALLLFVLCLFGIITNGYEAYTLIKYGLRS